MYPHTVTVWHITGETDRKAVWSRQLLPMVRFEETRGSIRRMNGDTTEDNFELFVPYDTDISKGDRVLFGDVTDLTPPTSALTVEKVEMFRIGNKTSLVEASGGKVR